MARKAMLYMAGMLIGASVAFGLSMLLVGCAAAGQIHKRAAAMPVFDRDSLDCMQPGMPRTGAGSLTSAIYRMSGSLVQYDSIGTVAAGIKANFPDIWLQSGRYYEYFAARDSGGVSCFVYRWFTVRGMPQAPTPDPLAPGER